MLEHRTQILCTCLLLCAAAQSWASFIPLVPEIGKYSLGLQLQHLEDPSNELNIHDVSRGAARDDFTRSKQVSPNYGWSDSSYWFKFHPINTSDKPQMWFLEFDYAPLDTIEIWRVNQDTTQLMASGGDHIPFNQRPLKHFKHTFQIPLAAQEKSEIYLRIQSTSIIKTGATLWNESRFYQHQRNELTKMALISGLLLTLAAYNFIIFLQLRDKNYALFSIMLVSVFLQNAAHSGISSEWLWPDSVAFSDYSPLITGSLSFSAITLFFRNFLHTKDLEPTLDKIFLSFLVIFIICTPLVFINYSLAAKLITYTLIPSLCFDFIACAYIWAKGFQAARLLLFAWGFYLIAGLFYALTLLGVLPDILGDYDYITSGGAIAMILLAAALSDRLQLIQIQHKKLKEKLLFEIKSGDQLKNAFLDTISHELRTPIHGIKGCLGLIDENDLNDEKANAFHMAQQSTANLERLIERLLLFSDAVAGRLKIESEQYPFAQEIQRLIEEYQALYPNTSIILDDIPSDCQWLQVDGKKLTMALQQLLDNACRFSVNRSVGISINLNHSSKTSSGQLNIRIEDTGVGMKKSVLDKAIIAFEQKDQSFSRSHGGLGVGLTLCDRLIELLSGKLHVDSMWGRGTEILVQLPVETCKAPANERSKITQSQQRSLSALVVEDNPVNQKVLQGMLARLNCQTVCADHGEQALEIYNDRKEPFDLIFMDCQMPIMDGFEATQNIRQHEKNNGSYVPIIAVTANAMTGDKDKCLTAGMDDYLVKPVKPVQLEEAIKKNIAIVESAKG